MQATCLDYNYSFQVQQYWFEPYQESMKFEIVFIVFLVNGTSAWLFDLDLNLNSALRPGGAYTANKGCYLQDSFRNDVLAPTMMGIEKELKANHRNDFIVEALLVVGLLVNMVVSIYLLIKTKYLMRRIRNK